MEAGQFISERSKSSEIAALPKALPVRSEDRKQQEQQEQDPLPVKKGLGTALADLMLGD